LGFCSWIPYVAVVVYDYWGYLPGGWQQWILFTLYFPALLVLLKPMLVSWIQRRWNSKPTTG
jgi:hypothetical protein